MTNHSEIKQVGKFIIEYRNKYHVAISWAGCSRIDSQTSTGDTVNNFLIPTKRHCALTFEGAIYPGIIFRIPPTMSCQELEERLRNI